MKRWSGYGKSRFRKVADHVSRGVTTVPQTVCRSYTCAPAAAADMAPLGQSGSTVELANGEAVRAAGGVGDGVAWVGTENVGEAGGCCSPDDPTPPKTVRGLGRAVEGQAEAEELAIAVADATTTGGVVCGCGVEGAAPCPPQPISSSARHGPSRLVSKGRGDSGLGCASGQPSGWLQVGGRVRRRQPRDS